MHVHLAERLADIQGEVILVQGQSHRRAFNSKLTDAPTSCPAPGPMATCSISQVMTAGVPQSGQMNGHLCGHLTEVKHDACCDPHIGKLAALSGCSDEPGRCQR